MHVDRELFPDSGVHARCQLCKAPLSNQKHANRRTKLFGLCFVCISEFENGPSYQVDTFLKNANRCQMITKRRQLNQNRISRRNRRFLSGR